MELLFQTLHWMIWIYHLGECRNELCAQTKRAVFLHFTSSYVSHLTIRYPRVKCSLEKDIEWVKDPLDKLVDRNPRSNGCMTLKEVDEMKTPIINAAVSQTLTIGDSTFSSQQKLLQAISNQCKNKEAEDFVTKQLHGIYEKVVEMNKEEQTPNAKRGLASLPAVETNSTYVRKKGSPERKKQRKK